MDFFRRTPLFGVLAALVAGIVAASLAGGVEWYVWAACSAACFAIAIAAIFSARTHFFLAAWVYVGLAVAFFGAFVGRMSAPQSAVPQGVRLSLEVVIDEPPTWRGSRSMHTSGRLISAAFLASPGLASGLPNVASGSSNLATGERLLIAFDTMWRFNLGDRVRFTGYVNAIDSVSGSYGRLMRARGFTGRTYISQYSFPLLAKEGWMPRADEGSPAAIQKRYFFKNLQSAATSRLEKLGLKADAQAIAAAMTTGARNGDPGPQNGGSAGISAALKTAYSRTGASHLLAVSGLHVGVIFLIINGLLYFLPLVHGGRTIKNLLAVAAIWIYAAVTGMSPSVMRAAMMFTGAQLAVALGVTRSAANVLCGAAVVMLSLWPGMVFDVSFQLSFLAVAGIMCWFSMIYGLVRSRWLVLNALWSTLIVGFTASLATMPLVSHVFGVISPLGVLLNPILMVTAWIVVAFSAVWIALPWEFWSPLFRWLIGGAAGVQNAVIQSVSAVEGVAVEFRLSTLGVCTVYGVLIMLTLWATTHRPRLSFRAGSGPVEERRGIS